MRMGEAVVSVVKKTYHEQRWVNTDFQHSECKNRPNVSLWSM
jgi:hypothetical protein